MSNNALSLFSTGSLDESLKRAEIIVKSKLVPKGFDTPEAVLVACTFGSELGFSPTQSLNLLSVTNGKPTLSFNGYMALCVKHGGWIDEIKSDDKEAVIHIHRPGRDKPVVGVYTLQQAVKAGLLSKDTWVKYPKQMLFARATVEAIRRAFPDVVSGIYSDEEMEQVGNTTSKPSKATEEPKRVLSAKNHEILKNVVQSVGGSLLDDGVEIEGQVTKKPLSTMIEIPDTEIVEVKIPESTQVQCQVEVFTNAEFNQLNPEHLKILADTYSKYFSFPTEDQIGKLKLWVSGQGLTINEIDDAFKARKAKTDATKV